jgi:hypothetical protein
MVGVVDVVRYVRVCFIVKPQQKLLLVCMVSGKGGAGKNMCHGEKSVRYPCMVPNRCRLVCAGLDGL